MRIGIIDYGCGNYTSVWNAILKIVPEDRIMRINSARDFDSITHLILPGVGAFKHAMNRLQQMGLQGEIQQYITENKPFLGICVGMQIMARYGNEFERCKGLGVIDSEVVRFDDCGGAYSIPHIGWNSLTEIPDSCLFTGIDEEATFYFVHSYYAELYTATGVQWGKASYAETDFAATFSKGNIHGVQFHPEKSQHYGLKLLKNFIGVVGG